MDGGVHRQHRARVSEGDAGNSCVSAQGASAEVFGCAFAQIYFCAQGCVRSMMFVLGGKYARPIVKLFALGETGDSGGYVL